MTEALARFREAAGFGVDSLVIMIGIVATLIFTLWACWSMLGQFQLWAGGTINIGQFFFGTLRVIAVLIGLAYVFSDFV